VLFVRVLCASAVRVGVCGGSVCLGALRFSKKKKKKKKKKEWLAAVSRQPRVSELRTRRRSSHVYFFEQRSFFF